MVYKTNFEMCKTAKKNHRCSKTAQTKKLLSDPMAEDGGIGSCGAAW